MFHGPVSFFTFTSYTSPLKGQKKKKQSATLRKDKVTPRPGYSVVNTSTREATISAYFSQSFLTKISTLSTHILPSLSPLLGSMHKIILFYLPVAE